MKNVKILLSAILIFSVFMPIFADDKSVIKIEQAQKTEYKKDVNSGDDTIVLMGNVRVSVTRGSKTTTITADKVNYNRANDMIYAEGKVTLEQSSGGSAGGETVTAESLLFNTATLEGVFDNGRAVQTSSDALNLPSGSTLIVASDIFGRDSGGTIAFKSGNLTFCDDENPHWRIKASRIWLLPGGEFAFLNAVLYVGRIPLLWIPAFYYPKDELVFNPAFGYKKRTGYFINTTTYLFGRKTAESSSKSTDDDDDKINFFSLMNTTSQKEQVREGLVLHNLDEDFKGDTSHYAKVLLDYYSNIGFMTGFDMNIAPSSFITNLVANLELGFSNTVFKNNSEYLPYNSVGEKVADSSNFMGIEIPFRYQANLKFSFNKPFNLSVSLPLYSDPFFDYDFNKRQESMDWIDYAMNGGKSEKDDDEETISETSSFTWNVNGSYNFKIPESFNPFISSLSISSFSSSVVYSSKSNDSLSDRDEAKTDANWKTNTPERKFYYPSQVNPFKISTRISGTLFKYPYSPKKNNSEKPTLFLLDEFKTEEQLEKDKEDLEKRKAERLAKENDKNDKNDEQSTKKDDSKIDKDEEVEEKKVFDESVLPSLNVPSLSSKTVNGGISYSLGYSVSPDFTSQFSYSSTNLKTPEDFAWSDMQSTYIQVKAPTTLSSSLGYKDSFFSLSNSFSFNPVYQKHPYLKKAEIDENGKENTSNGGYSESSIKSIKNADFNARKLDLTNTNTATIKPFYYTEHFANTSLSWNSTIKLVDTKYISDDPEEPEWEYLTMELWNKDEFTTHNLSATLAASEFENKLSQSFTLTSTLHPRAKSYRGNLNLTFPYVSLSASTGIKENETEKTEKNADTWEYWIKEDLSQSLSIKMFNSKLNFTQSYIYDFEEKEHESFRLALSGYGAQLAYTASYVAGYEFDVTEEAGVIVKRNGWKAKSSDDKKFQPYQLSLAYTNPSKTFKYWSERISFAPTLSASLVYDFLRPTNSYFVFKPGITFKVNNFLDISFSAETRNSVIYRYFCSSDDYEFYYNGKGERNILEDLKNSFRFDDKELRENSAFKMKSVNLSVTHNLDDWDFNFGLKVSPTLVKDKDASGNVRSYYDFSPEISLSVAWRPLSSMKTEIVYEKDDNDKTQSVWKLNP